MQIIFPYNSIFILFYFFKGTHVYLHRQNNRLSFQNEWYGILFVQEHVLLYFLVAVSPLNNTNLPKCSCAASPQQ